MLFGCCLVAVVTASSAIVVFIVSSAVDDSILAVVNVTVNHVGTVGVLVTLTVVAGIAFYCFLVFENLL